MTLDIWRGASYILPVIRTFKDRHTEDFWNGENVRRFESIKGVALRKLDMLNTAARLGDLRVPIGNRLEALKGGRRGQHSIRINDQWRVCFVWTQDGPAEVEITKHYGD
ncbi:MAG TPA: type II toxin-antitoxin system RelE/ParE family toxin [Stellaceae bacterium]|nr:type II toxin-antitoxin system RelE/ParE family toxin [Stellaceae bacterium]